MALEFGRISEYLAHFNLFVKSKQKSSGSLCYRSKITYNTIQHQSPYMKNQEWGSVCMNDVTAHIFLSTSVPGFFWQHGETGRDSKMMMECYERRWMQAPVILQKR